MKNETKRFFGLFIAVGICLGVGGLGAIATTPEIQGWFQTVNKPTWNPPSWIFGPVWTTLYVMMGVSVWRVWDLKPWGEARLAFTFFTIQLVLNLAWSWMFFHWHQIGWALVDIALLWIVVVATIVAFAKHSRLAMCLLLPYLAWISFASVLNYAIWSLN